VDHRLRATSADDAERARLIATALGASFVLHTVSIPPGPNLQARARAARRAVLPPSVMTGHTADDQAETLLIRLLRGAGATGLGGMAPGPEHPILALRRHETEAVCAQLDLRPVRDPSNDRPDGWRNRIRHELLPLASDIAERDVTALVARTADLLRDDDRFLEDLAGEIDPTDAHAVAGAPPVLARRAIRRWLTVDGYPPDAASIERVLAVAHGHALACELPGGRTVRRSRMRLRVFESKR
jgi:tRNA(Ile)-lysidine synthase